MKIDPPYLFNKPTTSPASAVSMQCTPVPRTFLKQKLDNAGGFPWLNCSSSFFNGKLSDYSDTKAIRILNSELADTLGNLLSRCTATVLNPDQVFPGIGPTALRDVASLDVTKKLMDSVSELPGKVEGRLKGRGPNSWWIGELGGMGFIESLLSFTKTLKS